MSSVKEDAHNAQFVFCDNGGRPTVDQYSHQPQFRPNDRVYVTTPIRKGPFIVSSVVSGKYTLCDVEKRPVDNGKEFEESELEIESEDFA